MNRRTRLAVTLAASVLGVVVLVTLLAGVLAVWLADDPPEQSRTGVVRVGGEVTVVVWADPSAAAAGDARRDVLRWLAVAAGIAVLPAAALGWYGSGRLLRTVDDALDELEGRERERRRRLDEVVHELRTPLAVASTNLELAVADPSLDDDTERLITAAHRATERMGRTVDDLAEHGRLAVDATHRVDLGTAARAVVTEHAGPALARTIRLVAAGEASLVVPAGDPAAVHTALGNLVDNAVRLAPGGSTVTVRSGTHAGWAWVAVEDEGPGIARADQERVFDRGWRGRHDRDRDRRGQHGLGLTIARQLTEANGGLLTLQSVEGRGSVFTLWLPQSPDALERDVVDDDRVHPVVEPWRAPFTPA